MNTPWMNTELSFTQRAECLLAEMTLPEKVGQMIQLNGCDANIKEIISQKNIGSVLHVMGETANTLQEYSRQSRLAIPLLLGLDVIHGHSFWKNATIFPTALPLSNSWNEKLVEQTARFAAKEAAATGVHWAFAPQLDICRDIRWGRMGETFGEDQLLTAKLATAMSKGFQGEDLSAHDSLLACAKHFVGYGDSQGGRDASESDLSRRKLLSEYLPAFEYIFKQGCGSLMTGYQCIDGVPCTFNTWLMQDVLREEWDYDGLVVTDWDNVGHSVNIQFVSPDVTDAAARTIRAGNDLIMSTTFFYEGALAAVKQGLVTEEMINSSVRRILRVKFRLGLFDNIDARRSNPEQIQKIISCAEHRATALEAARQSQTLLTNNDILPLQLDTIKNIAVIGPNADDVFGQLGGWSFGSPQQEFTDCVHDNIVTILDGIRNAFEPSVSITYKKGCSTIDTQFITEGWFTSIRPKEHYNIAEGEFEQAITAAKNADIIIAVVGDGPDQVGEQRDRSDMNLGGRQEELLRAAHATGTPLVAVIVASKPHTIPWLAEHADAILWAGNPGSDGGTAVAEVLSGAYNPCGHLTQGWPKHLGQQPISYGQIPGWHTDRYVEHDINPLFAFGYGLSYTTFSCAGINIERHDDTFIVSTTVTNTGKQSGSTVVQCYGNDLITSVTTPLKQLYAWQRVHLEAGKQQTVELSFSLSQLSLINEQLERVIEPGDFDIMVGLSSRDEDLEHALLKI